MLVGRVRLGEQNSGMEKKIQEEKKRENKTQGRELRRTRNETKCLRMTYKKMNYDRFSAE